MLTVALAVIAAVCAFNWLKCHVCCEALILYIKRKNHTPPSDEEIKACVSEVWGRKLKIKKD